MTVKKAVAPEAEFDINNWEPVIHGPTWTVTEEGTYPLPKYTLAWELAEWCARWLKIEDKETGEELPFTFTPEQLRFLCWFYAIDETGRFLYSRAMFQRMKGPIADTELVPTPGGWKRHGDLKIGDQVFAIDGTPTDVVDIPFAGTGRVFRIHFSDGSTVDADEHHRWPVIANGEPGTFRTDEIAGLKGWEFWTHERAGREPRRFVRMEPLGRRPVQCITVAHPSHQYLVGEGMVPTHNSGKDMIAAVLALFEAAGPCRLDYIDEEGEVHGRRIKDAYIQLAGVTQDQSRNTSDFFHTLLTKEAIEEFNFNIGKEVSYAFGGMVQIWLLTANPKAAEGKRPTFVVLNEVQWWLQSNKGVEQYQVLKGNVAKRPQSSQGHMLIIANAPIPGQDSIGEQLIQSYEDTLAGKGEDRDFLYDSLEAPSNTPVDREILEEVVSVIRGDSYWLDPESVASDFFDPLVPLTEARRKWLNQRIADSDSVYSTAQIAAAEREAQLRPGDEIVLGFDGGRTNDATALVAIRVKDRVIIPIRVWEKPREVEEWVVPHDQVESAVHDTFKRYKVRGFFADVNLWESFILSWSADYGEQLAIRASGESAIGWDMRGVRKATLAHERLVDGLQSGKVFHNGDPVLVQHISNARKRYNVHGMSFGKESRDSSRKVDAYAATVLAYEALTVYLDRGRKAEKPARTGRVLMY